MKFEREIIFATAQTFCVSNSQKRGGRKRFLRFAPRKKNLFSLFPITIYNREVLRRLRRLRRLLKDTFCLYIAQKRFFYVSHINYKIINLINCLIKYSLNEISN
jgi:hypothetical protein